MNNDVEIIGIADPCYLPKIYPETSCNQVCQTGKLYIKECLPPIKDILQLKVNVCVLKKKTICTSCGKKIVLTGEKNIKIMYVAKNKYCTVHSAKWCIPFCMYINLKDTPYKITDVIAAVGNAEVNLLDDRCIWVSMLICACTEIDRCCYKKKSYCRSLEEDNYGL